MQINDIKPNPDNPRIIKDEKFKQLVKSIQDFPQMLELRPIRKQFFGCHYCRKVFYSNKSSKNREPKYCSNECYGKSLLKLRECPVCKKMFPSDPQTKFCSEECFKIGRTSRVGIILSDEWKAALSAGRKASDKCKGPNLYNWKGGKQTQPERSKISAHKRRDLQKIEIDKEFLQRLLIAQNNQCFYCDADLTEYKAIEHLTPLSRGGDNHPYNLVYACKSCNSKKRQNTLEEFAIKNNSFHLIDKFDLVFPAAYYG